MTGFNLMVGKNKYGSNRIRCYLSTGFYYSSNMIEQFELFNF